MACSVSSVSSVMRAPNLSDSNARTKPHTKTVQLKVDEANIKPQRIFACICKSDEDQNIEWQQHLDSDGGAWNVTFDLSYASDDTVYKIMGLQWIASSWRCVSLVKGKTSDLEHLEAITLQEF